MSEMQVSSHYLRETHSPYRQLIDEPNRKKKVRVDPNFINAISQFIKVKK